MNECAVEKEWVTGCSIDGRETERREDESDVRRSKQGQREGCHEHLPVVLERVFRLAFCVGEGQWRSSE